MRIRQVQLWQKEIENKPEALVEILKPFSEHGADLKVLMKYSLPGNSNLATIEIFPGKDRRALMAAQEAGLSLSPTPVLLIEGNNRQGLAYAIAKATAVAGIKVKFLSAQVAGKQYSALLGFQTNADARKASDLIRIASIGNNVTE
jgi:hypothetical protein